MKVLTFSGKINIFRTFKQQTAIINGAQDINLNVVCSVACTNKDDHQVLQGVINVNGTMCAAHGFGVGKGDYLLSFAYNDQAYIFVVSTSKTNENAILCPANDNMDDNSVAQNAGFAKVAVTSTEYPENYAKHLINNCDILLGGVSPGLLKSVYGFIQSNNGYKACVNLIKESDEILKNCVFNVYDLESSVIELSTFLEPIKNIVDEMNMFAMNTQGVPASKCQYNSEMLNKHMLTAEMYNPKTKTLHSADKAELTKAMLFAITYNSIKNNSNCILDFCDALVTQREVADLCADSPVYVYCQGLISEEDDLKTIDWLLDTFNKVNNNNQKDIAKIDLLTNYAQQNNCNNKLQQYITLYNLYNKVKTHKNLDDVALTSQIKKILKNMASSLNLDEQTNANIVS